LMIIFSNRKIPPYPLWWYRMGFSISLMPEEGVSETS